MSNFSIRYMATVGLLYLAGAYSAILVLPLQAQSISIVGDSNNFVLLIDSPNSFTFPVMRPTIIVDSPLPPNSNPKRKPSNFKEVLLNPNEEPTDPKPEPVETKPEPVETKPEPVETKPEPNRKDPNSKKPSDDIPICPPGKLLKDC